MCMRLKIIFSLNEPSPHKEISGIEERYTINTVLSNASEAYL